MNWLIPANPKIYDHASSLEHHGFIDWKQNKTRYQVGDIIYIYCSLPIQRIRYQCSVEIIDIPFTEVRDDKAYWLDLSGYEEAQNGVYFRLKLLGQIDSDQLDLTLLQAKGTKSGTPRT